MKSEQHFYMFIPTSQLLNNVFEIDIQSKNIEMLQLVSNDKFFLDYTSFGFKTNLVNS